MSELTNLDALRRAKVSILLDVMINRLKGNISIYPKKYTRSGLNFINVLHTAFMLADPKSVKRY
jgi:hypothetical protein